MSVLRTNGPLVSNTTPNLDTVIHLFEHIIEPIALDGSEILGTVSIQSSKIQK